MMFSYIYVCVVFIAWGVGLGRPEKFMEGTGGDDRGDKGGVSGGKKKQGFQGFDKRKDKARVLCLKKSGRERCSQH